MYINKKKTHIIKKALFRTLRSKGYHRSCYDDVSDIDEVEDEDEDLINDTEKHMSELIPDNNNQTPEKKKYTDFVKNKVTLILDHIKNTHTLDSLILHYISTFIYRPTIELQQYNKAYLDIFLQIYIFYPNTVIALFTELPNYVFLFDLIVKLENLRNGLDMYIKISCPSENDNDFNNPINQYKKINKLYKNIINIFVNRIKYDYYLLMEWNIDLDNLPIISNASFCLSFLDKKSYIRKNIAYCIFRKKGYMSCYRDLITFFKDFHNYILQNKKEDYFYENDWKKTDLLDCCFKKSKRAFNYEKEYIV